MVKTFFLSILMCVWLCGGQRFFILIYLSALLVMHDKKNVPLDVAKIKVLFVNLEFF